MDTLPLGSGGHDKVTAFRPRRGALDVRLRRWARGGTEPGAGGGSREREGGVRMVEARQIYRDFICNY